MTRCLILLRARPILLLVLLSIVAAPTALAQDATTQERLDRLERDLSMLQRQVYRGTEGEAPAGAGGNDAAVGMQVRMDRLEQQMRDLTGRVEDETNAVAQLRQRLEQINSDIDVRLGQGPGQRPRPPSGGPDMAAGEPQSASDPAAAPYRRPRAPEPPSPPDQSASYGTLTPPGPAA
ncbi:MAG: YbgF trimerization domain-containing protein, partial [Stellaceae bacterium]